MSNHPNLDILYNYGGIDTNSLLSVTNMFEDDNNEINLIKQSRYFSIDDLLFLFFFCLVILLYFCLNIYIMYMYIIICTNKRCYVMLCYVMLISCLNNRHECFSIMSLNIQSINAKFNSFTTLIDLINEKNNNTLSAICLQETWLGEADKHSLFHVPNYYCISQPKQCSSHAGLIIYVHRKFQYQVLNIFNKSEIWEGLAICIYLEHTNKNIVLANIYKPPKENNNMNIETFVNELNPSIQN